MLIHLRPRVRFSADGLRDCMSIGVELRNVAICGLSIFIAFFQVTAS